MTEEAQAQDEYVEVVEETIEAVQVEDSEIATEEPQTEDDREINQDAINKVINKKHFEKKEAERKEAAERQRADDLEKQLNEMRQSQAPKTVPDVPDPYSDTYEDDLAARDRALIAKAQNDAYQAQITQQTNQRQQEEFQQKQEHIRKQAKTYTENAVKQGITEDELRVAGNTVAQYGVSDELTMALLGDKDGASITRYLASNLGEIDTLSTMTGYQAAVYINENVRDKASALKPKTSNTPQPPTEIAGGGIDKDAGKYHLIGGATFT